MSLAEVGVVRYDAPGGFAGADSAELVAGRSPVIMIGDLGHDALLTAFATILAIAAELLSRARWAVSPSCSGCPMAGARVLMRRGFLA
jgi:hypothetical protein